MFVLLFVYEPFPKMLSLHRQLKTKNRYIVRRFLSRVQPTFWCSPLTTTTSHQRFTSHSVSPVVVYLLNYNCKWTESEPTCLLGVLASHHSFYFSIPLQLNQSWQLTWIYHHSIYFYTFVECVRISLMLNTTWRLTLRITIPVLCSCSVGSVHLLCLWFLLVCLLLHCSDLPNCWRRNEKCETGWELASQIKASLDFAESGLVQRPQ